jgi:dTDP-4-amino-4,6-dideoxygalactose transaminase
MQRVVMKIPMLDLKLQHERLSREIEAAVHHVLETQQFILGPEVKEFEKEIAEYCGCAHAVGCANGSDALLLALMACGVAAGDEVITSPFTFFATAGAVVRLGARPVFVDIDPVSFNIDASQVKAVITDRTRAIMPVHLFGQCADMEPILVAANGRGIPVIEDAAQAIGSEYRGRRAGGLGLVGSFSFYPSKNLGGAGDGGMLTTNDAEIADALRSLRTHGARKKYYHDRVGMNSRLDSLQAAILRVKLHYLDEWASARRKNAGRYRSLFSATSLEARAEVRLPVESAGGLHVYNQFVIRARDRDQLKTHLAEQGIGTEIYYPLPLHLQACFKDLGYRPGDLPEAERAANEALAIPVYPELTEEQQQYVVEAIEAFYTEG